MDAITYEQLFNVSPRSPEHALWAEVLNMAVMDYLTWKVMGDRFAQYGHDAGVWIFNGNPVGHMPFNYICDLLGISPDRIRHVLRSSPSQMLGRMASGNLKKPRCQTQQGTD